MFLQPVLVVLAGRQTTDKGAYTPLDEASYRLKSKGAPVFVLGIGKDVNTTELNQIASGPDNVFRVDSFKDLYDKAPQAKTGICVLGIAFFRSFKISFYLPHNNLGKVEKGSGDEI